MKYMKTYRVFESSNDIEDVNDICLEFEDLGFDILSFGDVDAGDDVMQLRIDSNRRPFK